MIEVSLAEPAVELGGRVEVGVRWQLEKAAQSLAVHFGWATEGFGDQVTASVGHELVALTDADGRTGSRTFAWEVPTGNPVTYRGQDLTVRWTVSAAMEVKWGRDQQGSAEVVVAPAGGRRWWQPRAAG